MPVARLPCPLENRAQIGDLVHRYALNVRRGTAALCEALMTEDVEFEIRQADPAVPGVFRQQAHLIGRVATVNHISQNRGGLVMCPLIHNLLIELDGAVAHSSCVMEGRSYPPGSEVIGEYRDSYRFEDRWRFTHRIYTMFVPAASLADEHCKEGWHNC